MQASGIFSRGKYIFQKLWITFLNFTKILFGIKNFAKSTKFLNRQVLEDF